MRQVLTSVLRQLQKFGARRGAAPVARPARLHVEGLEDRLALSAARPETVMPMPVRPPVALVAVPAQGWNDQLITEVTFPALDATSKDLARVSLRVAEGSVYKLAAAPQAPISGPAVSLRHLALQSQMQRESQAAALLADIIKSTTDSAVVKNIK